MAAFEVLTLPVRVGMSAHVQRRSLGFLVLLCSCTQGQLLRQTEAPSTCCH